MGRPPRGVCAVAEPFPASTATPTEPIGLTAAALSALIRTRKISSREVMQAYLAHIDRHNPAVTAIVSRVDGAALLAQADACDQALARGQYHGWMHGLPHAVKDTTASKGIATTLGSPLFANVVPQTDAIAVARLRAAGAIFIGKTNVPEFGLGSHTVNPVFGATGNAYDPTKSAGGSSGGAGVGLALRMLPVADGSDVMGSLRNPAGWNNVFGLRPTFGRVPSGPAPDVFGQQLGTDGPMARTVTDLALLLSVQAGYDPRAPLSLTDSPEVFAAPLQAEVAGLRIGWLGRLFDDMPFESGVLDLCEAALGRFEALGCHVEGARLDVPRDALWTAFLHLRHVLVAARYGPLARDPAKRALVKPEALWEVDQAEPLTGSQLQSAWQIRTSLYEALRLLFERFDVLVLPTAQLFPFDLTERWPKSIDGIVMDTYHRWMEVTVPATMAGCPGLAVPAGFGPGGTPMGLQLIGPHRGELGLLRLGHAYEQAAQDILGRLPPALAPNA